MSSFVSVVGLRIRRQNLNGAGWYMRPIRAIPSSTAPSDQTGGTLVRTARRSYGSVRPR